MPRIGEYREALGDNMSEPIPPFVTAIQDQAAAEFSAEVDWIVAALRLGIKKYGRQQAEADFGSWLVDRWGTMPGGSAALAMTAVVAMSRLAVPPEEAIIHGEGG